MTKAAAKKKRSGGNGRLERLQGMGFDDTKRVAGEQVPLTYITIPDTGILAHPRANEPPDEVLVADFMDRYRNGINPVIKKPAFLWERPVKGGKVELTLGDACRRVTAGIEAMSRLREAEEMGDDEELYIQVDWFRGSNDPNIDNELAFLMERQRRDIDDQKKYHNVTQLVASFNQMRSKGLAVERMVALAPRDWNLPTLELALDRFGELPVQVRKAFDLGIVVGDERFEVPIGHLTHLLKVADEEKLAALTEWVRAGYTPLGAARWLGRANRLTQAEERAEAEARAELSEELPAGALPAQAPAAGQRQAASKGAVERVERPVPRSDLVEQHVREAKQKARAQTVVEAIPGKTVRRMIAELEAAAAVPGAKVPESAKHFALIMAAEVALPFPDPKERGILGLTYSEVLPEPVQAVISAIRFRRGDDNIGVPDAVREALVKAKERPAKPEKTAAKKPAKSAESKAARSGKGAAKKTAKGARAPVAA